MTTATEFRPRCLACMRPVSLCLCASVPRVVTRTRLCILQHKKEHRHPFGTARLVGLSLPNAKVHIVHGGLDNDLGFRPELPADAALLFPHPDALDLEALPPEQRPGTLVVLDGTWAHVRRLYKHNPWLRELPHVKLQPAAPSNYRIRSEPRPDYISTLEAIVAALRILEPDTDGLDGLLAAFDGMIDGQLHHLHRLDKRGRFKTPRLKESRRLPALLEANNLVVVYGETALPGGDQGARRELVQWTAARLADGELFEVLVRPAGRPPTADHMRHFGLTVEQLERGVDLTEARQRFLAFADADAGLLAWTGTTLDWGRPLLADSAATAILKIAYCNLRNRGAGLLEQVIAREGLSAAPLPCAGRAQHRLGNALVMARWLRDQRIATTAAGAGAAKAPTSCLPTSPA